MIAKEELDRINNFGVSKGSGLFYQIFRSQQVKRCATITYKHGIYELPHELQNDLRLTILGNQEISGKFLKSIE